MKKVVIMLISTICLFTALFAGCGSGGSNSKEINVTGEQVMAGTLRRWISDRQETYYEKDIANEIEYHWFDFEMEMLFENYQMENDESSKITVEYELDGKMGIKYPLTTLWGSTVSLLYDFEIDVKAKNETIDENGNREVETVRMKGDVIYVDNICYADLTIESISASGEYKESTKTQGSLSDILDLEAGDITEILGAEADSEARIYGISIDALLDSVASQSGVYYYLDEDNNFHVPKRKTEDIVSYF